MAQFKALAQNVEVNGKTVLSFINGMGTYQSIFENALRENGINHPQKGDWYSQQAWLNAFSFIASKTGPATLKTIGKQIIESAVWPPNVNTIEASLASIDVAYHINHRGGEIGHYYYEKVGERTVRIVCNNPYPCDFDMGVIDGAAKKFTTLHQKPFIQHDHPGVCRKIKGDICSYLISW